LTTSCCTDNSCCCGTPEVRAASTVLTAKDILGACRVRLGIGRMDYKVEPGLWRVGEPDENAPVLVSANYKLTFDTLRSTLAGLDCWLLILDTNGVNVWCAAGKGAFGTEELVNRIGQSGLAGVVSHRKLIVPQLGASRMKAHEVLRQTGFSVVYGPVRAGDIQAFLAAGCRATREMRAVQFTLRDRLVLTPVEVVSAAKTSLFAFGVLFLLNLFAASPFGPRDVTLYAGAVLAGTVVTPALLPYIPGRAFSFKGWLTGLLWTAGMLHAFGWFTPGLLPLSIGYLLLLPALSGWFSLNFTGSSTCTSPSGVLKEMKISLPFLIGAASVGAVLVLVRKLFIGRL